MVEKRRGRSSVSGDRGLAEESRAEIEALREEHRVLLKELRRLDKSLARLSLERAEAAAVIPVLESLHALLADRIHPHMLRERRTLRPLLRRSGLSREREIRTIIAGDDGVEKECRQLKRALQQLKRETDEREAIRRVIAIGEGIIEVIIEHVHREEQVLFPRLEENLPSASSRPPRA
ncbi:Iron-sulfur cluster repair protein YtfE [bacterium HR10]|nr:Iron-sulfur cluster repair protein YtfE [bacterium HR10]